MFLSFVFKTTSLDKLCSLLQKKIFFAYNSIRLSYMFYCFWKKVLLLLFDCHVHTDFSPDSRTSLPQALSFAKAHGLGIITTEHLDYAFPPSGIDNVFSIPDYQERAKKHACPELLSGVEISMQAKTVRSNREFAEKGGFDLIIISQHSVDNYDIYQENFFY